MRFLLWFYSEGFADKGIKRRIYFRSLPNNTFCLLLHPNPQPPRFTSGLAQGANLTSASPGGAGVLQGAEEPPQSDPRTLVRDGPAKPLASLSFKDLLDDSFGIDETGVGSSFAQSGASKEGPLSRAKNAALFTPPEDIRQEKFPPAEGGTCYLLRVPKPPSSPVVSTTWRPQEDARDSKGAEEDRKVLLQEDVQGQSAVDEPDTPAVAPEVNARVQKWLTSSMVYYANVRYLAQCCSMHGVTLVRGCWRHSHNLPN